MNNWNRKELWRKFGKNFMVEVSRHEEPATDSGCSDSEGPHRWCVYAYIYPKHPHFATFDGTEAMWQDAAACLPLHGGPTFCRKHLNAKGEVTAYVAKWKDENGSNRGKSFPIREFGREGALAMALAYRREQLLKLKTLGFNYTDRHIGGDDAFCS